MLTNPDFSRYSTLVFDCDGVILNSNHIKTAAFYHAALPWGEKAARELVEYHITHGGISRYEKFNYFLRNSEDATQRKKSFETLVASYAQEVRNGLLRCDISQGLAGLRRALPSTRWLVVSGGDQNELHAIFDARNIRDFFDGGIYGSPDSKDAILEREMARRNIRQPAVLFGDSRYDHEAARRSGIDFVFVSDWSEFADWQTYTKEHALPAVGSLNDIAAALGNAA